MSHKGDTASRAFSIDEVVAVAPGDKTFDKLRMPDNRSHITMELSV